MHKELITFTENLVKNLVKQPDIISVQEFGGDDETILLEIIVHESDMGAIIGRSGKMANAIRTMVQAYAFLHELNRVKINIDSF
ncbi:MAG: KH domain-containing protein [Bacilli bacterium]|nr:KH domain-containing protein [Bacilli bacterium]MDD3895657.1 KH domain-containing protein [Bacilli bacterium]MDD4407976.1 KH domain-containing protein [Bacilli bacterium]